jgi:hypothetical protein
MSDVQQIGFTDFLLWEHPMYTTQYFGQSSLFSYIGTSSQDYISKLSGDIIDLHEWYRGLLRGELISQIKWPGAVDNYLPIQRWL